jgi:hypothetical protein
MFFIWEFFSLLTQYPSLMKKLSLIIGLLTMLSFNLQAQNISDALRYSILNPGSTARTLGVGGSLSALGGDFSVLSTNPAGLAVYRRSDFILSTGIYTTNTRSELIGGGAGQFKQSSANFTLDAIGFVINTRPISPDWKTFNFAIGLNRLANLHQEFRYEGAVRTSISDRFAELANGLSPTELDGFEAGPAYDVFAIDEFPTGSQNYFSYVTDSLITGKNIDKVYREQRFESTGGVNEMVISFAGNYQDRIMIGATVGIPFINYEERLNYVEEDQIDTIFPITSLTYNETLKTTGIGINLKLGLIYRFNQMVRLGLAVHTPTGFGLTDEYSSSVETVFDDGQGDGVSDSPFGRFDYRLRTPWRFMGSLGFIFARSGFLHAEVEWVDYPNASFNFTKDVDTFIEEEQDANDEITNNLQDALNIRIGGEYAYENLRFRAGYAIFGAPFIDDNQFDSAITAGIGFRENDFYLDLAYQQLLSEQAFTPYTLVDQRREPVVRNNITRSQVLLTFGIRF